MCPGAPLITAAQATSCAPDSSHDGNTCQAATGFFVAQEFATASADRPALAREAEQGDK
ncbi:hypothetical protein [Streptomyces sp. MUSC 14]|uniref:hypothetical protein n=1 Tax=Streptomyces sp. MUSC 14 TaxID=1354889 RepID=UPI0015A681D2|nr:hypothetical protein [Streptomyces sp. MUSC 14]